MKTSKFVFLAASTLLIQSIAHAEILEAWGPQSSPDIMSFDFEKKFSNLPLEGKAAGKDKFWSGDYWPLKDGNINLRWNSKQRLGFDLKSPSKAQALKMSQAQLAELSPAEKYDLFMGNYNYPLKEEVSHFANREAQDWEGICHGWAAAAMNYNEPKPKVMTNPDGIKVPFGSADIKGLLSYYYAYKFEVDNTHQIGIRCFRAGFINRNTYCKEDLNAGAYHIILSNRIGIKKLGFVADMDRFREVWNHPVMSYKSRLIKRNLKPDKNTAQGSVKMLEVETVVQYIAEVQSSWETTNGTSDQLIKETKYRYFLDLNASGEIIGGQWISGDRPDFLWLMPKAKKFHGNMSHLAKLLDE